MKTVNIPAKACPVVDEVDVLVVGGGAAGIGAAIGAAQCGASVALVEYFGALGGLLTNGYVTNCEAGVAISGDKILIKGVFDKLVTRMVEKGGAIRGYDLIRSNKYYPFDTSRCENDLQITPWDPEAFKLSADELMAEHGVKVYFYTQFTEILKEGNKVVGGVIENRSGRQVILAKRVGDCVLQAECEGDPLWCGELLPSDPGRRLPRGDDPLYRQREQRGGLYKGHY